MTTAIRFLQTALMHSGEKAYPVPTHGKRGLRVLTRERDTYEANSYCLLCYSGTTYHNLYVLVLLTLNLQRLSYLDLLYYETQPC